MNQNDPNIGVRRAANDNDGHGYMSWVLGAALVAIAVAIGLFAMTGSLQQTDTAANVSKPDMASSSSAK